MKYRIIMDISYVICERTTLSQFCDILNVNNMIVPSQSIIYDIQLLHSHFASLLQETDCQIVVVSLLPYGLMFVEKLLQWMVLHTTEIGTADYIEECLRHMTCSVSTTIELAGIK
jgi:hypothetical protein